MISKSSKLCNAPEDRPRTGPAETLIFSEWKIVQDNQNSWGPSIDEAKVFWLVMMNRPRDTNSCLIFSDYETQDGVDDYTSLVNSSQSRVMSFSAPDPASLGGFLPSKNTRHGYNNPANAHQTTRQRQGFRRE